MNGRLRMALLSLAAFGLFGAPFAATLDAQAASSRFRVLVPHLLPVEGADDDFGKDAGDELRDMINDLATHQPVDKDEIEDQADRFDMRMRDLDCVRSQQLASQIDAQVVVCGDYSEVGDNELEVRARFVVVRTNDAFEVEPFRVRDNDEGKKEAANQIFSSFDRVVQQQRANTFCQEYYNSQQWDNALENCDRAIELNPDAVSARYTRALTLEKSDRLEEALAEFEKVLELDPIHENALQWAGNVAARIGDEEKGRDYYEQYLELNPQDSNVRMNIAYDLAQAGDPEGAMQLLEEGFELDPDNVALYEQYGNFAFAAARNAMEEEGLNAQVGGAATAGQIQGQSGGSSDAIPPRVAELYGEAIDAYTRVFEEKGPEMEESQMRNVVAAHIQLGELQKAIDFAGNALDALPESARLWSIYADALQREGDLEEAIAALDRVKEIDPEYSNVSIRQGKWLLDSGQVEEALPRLQEAVERGEQTDDVVARLILADAHSKGVQQENYGYAVEQLQRAREFDVSDGVGAQLDFWHGFSIYQQAVARQEPQTLETAESTLPLFQRAQELFQGARPYAQEQPSINLNQFMDAVNTYIEIQEAIIKRGR